MNDDLFNVYGQDKTASLPQMVKKTRLSSSDERGGDSDSFIAHFRNGMNRNFHPFYTELALLFQPCVSYGEEVADLRRYY